jgi:membrane protein
MLAAFPAFNAIRQTLQDAAFTLLVPKVGAMVQAEVEEFVANAGQLTAVGIVGLAFTAVMLLVTIEDSFNAVFRVDRSRSPLARLLVYWTVLTLGPLLVGAGLSLQGVLTALSGEGSPLLARLAAPLPLLLTSLAFAIMYATIPNRRVEWRDALAGGLVAGLLFGALRFGFGWYVVSAKSYTTLYGALAIFPIFLFWMFLSWMAVMAGAEIAAALPEWRSGLDEPHAVLPAARVLTLAVDVLALVQEAARSPGAGIGRREILSATGLGDAAVAPVIEALERAGLVAPTHDQRLLLARDLDSVSLWDLVTGLGLSLDLDETIGAGRPWHTRLAERVGQGRRALAGQLDISLREIVG